MLSGVAARLLCGFGGASCLVYQRLQLPVSGQDAEVCEHEGHVVVPPPDVVIPAMHSTASHKRCTANQVMHHGRGK